MKHLIIYAHPSQQSLNHSIKQSLVNELSVNHEVKVRDLYQLEFNPVLSEQDLQGQRNGQVDPLIQTEQQWITWAECITFIYPTWWAGMPAILKGYIDRVFSYGFAYRYVQGEQQGLLTNKQVVIINTQGKSMAEYEESGMAQAISMTIDRGIMEYCGLTLSDHIYLDRADRADAEQLAHWNLEISERFGLK
ncbi:flavodoxin family protein [Vibrio sp. CAIM 722]|uniref:Flavodoxin family protein n=1 Tax=Vibrio eleionomae TaxID=2653505 RepID=A0A7X4RW02_9VIBR|nr:NAD(P)H-dependent oxidoreductase [Vibrio eleionomae]MZI95511.1 flavodoxin family protein [Vibrio eleionomae]